MLTFFRAQNRATDDWCSAQTTCPLGLGPANLGSALVPRRHEFWNGMGWTLCGIGLVAKVGDVKLTQSHTAFPAVLVDRAVCVALVVVVVVRKHRIGCAFAVHPTSIVGACLGIAFRPCFGSRTPKNLGFSERGFGHGGTADLGMHQIHEWRDHCWS